MQFAVRHADYWIVLFGLTWRQYRDALLEPALWTTFAAMTGMAAYRSSRQAGTSPQWMMTLFAVVAVFALWRTFDAYNGIEDADPCVDRSARWQMVLTGLVVLAVALSIDVREGSSVRRGARDILTTAEGTGAAFLIGGFRRKGPTAAPGLTWRSRL